MRTQIKLNLGPLSFSAFIVRTLSTVWQQEHGNSFNSIPTELPKFFELFSPVHQHASSFISA
ncbi:hypothetical protein D7Y55_00820 [Stenotrophomonas maltophilia]|nr:hypothetical protein [Stenotrophomonas maltophilia]